MAEAFILGEGFIGHEKVALILGDNIFYGSGLSQIVQDATKLTSGATVFGYHVNDPERFGVVDLDETNHVTAITEKPKHPKSHYAVTGLYFYDNHVVEYAKQLKPSQRGELEITDLNNIYLKKKQLKVQLLGRGFAWLDTGTHESLLEAASFISTVQKRQNLKIACLEEIAYRMHYIDTAQLIQLAHPLEKNDYGQYLLRLAREKVQN